MREILSLFFKLCIMLGKIEINLEIKEIHA